MKDINTFIIGVPHLTIHNTGVYLLYILEEKSMNYIKSCLIITMLLGIGYSQCNEDNRQEYYPDLQGCSLTGANLVMANLAWADLTDAWLLGADLSFAILEGATLVGANIAFANLNQANLAGADFSNSACRGVYFVGANLNNTIFDGADLTYTYFDENADYYDDESYEVGYNTGAQSGDVNGDGELNIIDLLHHLHLLH